jgi:DNA-binding transcriptional MerR regulator
MSTGIFPGGPSVRIAELSQRSGVTVATIKYYLREGLLPPGESTARNQARYSELHLNRLGLIRALREGAGLSIATLGRVFAALEAHEDHDRPTYLSLAVGALSDPVDVPGDEAGDYERAGREVGDLLAELGWDTDPGSPGHDDLVRALVAVHRFLPGTIRQADQLRPYAEAMHTLADLEIPETYDPASDPAATLQFSVLGTALFEPVILALRKLAHVDRIRHLDKTRRAGRSAPRTDR